jgi:hypothetical protein
MVPTHPIRFSVPGRLIPAWSLLLLALASPAPGAETSVVPDIGRYFDTWLWVKSEGMMATSTPETRGAARTLILNSDLSYEYQQRRGAADSLLCSGRYYFSEESGEGRLPTDFLDFEGWFEPYEHRMTTDFLGRDTLFLVGDRCDNCPEHMFVRGRTAAFEGSVTRGTRFRHDLWDGLALELDPTEGGWEICVRDSTHPPGDLARLAAPLQGSRSFTFSREPGRPGWGALDIEDIVLTPPKPGEKAAIQSMRFRVAIEEVRRSGARAR